MVNVCSQGHVLFLIEKKKLCSFRFGNLIGSLWSGFASLFFYFVFAFTSYELWQSLLIIQIICGNETEFYKILVFPHYRMSIPCQTGILRFQRYSRLELFSCVVNRKSNPALILFDTITRHMILLIMLTSNTASLLKCTFTVFTLAASSTILICGYFSGSVYNVKFVVVWVIVVPTLDS
jgi:hypothetical protein